MQDHRKTKKQLVDELQALRARVADLEAESSSDSDEQGGAAVKSRHPRNAIETPIVFIGAFNLIYAEGVNLSEGGVCFEISEPLLFEMEFDIGGEVHKHTADLIWMKRLATGRSRLGLQFESSDSLSLLQAYKEKSAESSDE